MEIEEKQRRAAERIKEKVWESYVDQSGGGSRAVGRADVYVNGLVGSGEWSSDVIE